MTLRIDGGYGGVVSWGDHRSFWKQGYRALLVTDTVFNRYRHYHFASDTPDKISHHRFVQAVMGLNKTFAKIAAAGLSVDWRQTNRRD